MPIYDTPAGLTALDTRPLPDPEEDRPHGRIFTKAREAAQHGTLDEMAEAVVREAYGALTEPWIDSLAMQGYQDIGATGGSGPWQGPIDLNQQMRRQEVQWARTLAAFSPPAKNALRLHRTYVLGQGIPMPTAQDSDVQEVIEDEWDDPDNAELCTHQGQAETDAAWLTTGELFLALHVDDDDGHVKWRSVEPTDVDTVVLDPNDRKRTLYYRVRQHRDRFDFAAGQAQDDVAAGAPNEYVYYPDWANADPERDPYSGKAGPLAPGGAVMASFPLNRQGVRGIPDLTAAVPWIQSHKRLLEAQSIMAEAKKKIALVKTVKGGPQAVGSAAALEQSSLAADFGRLERNPARAPGSTYVKNKGIELEYPDLGTGADDAQRDAEMHAQMIGAATGWGTHYLLMSTEFHRLATAVTMELPTLKMCLEGQQRWLDMLRSVLDYALLWAAKKGKVKAPVVRKHGREVVDWKRAESAPPHEDDEDEAQTPNADRLTPAREMEPQDVIAQAQHQTESKQPENKAKKAAAQRGHYQVDMPPVLSRDLQPTVQAIEAAAQGGHITPEQAARQVMLAMGFGEIDDALEEWRRFTELHGAQIEKEAQQAQDMAHKDQAVKAGPPGGPDGGGGGAKPALPGSQGAAAPSGGLSRNPVARETEAGTPPFEGAAGAQAQAEVREAAGAGHWVTIEEEGIATHIFIQGGRVTKGPAGLIGATPGHLPPGPNRTVTHHPVGHEPARAREHPHYVEHQSPPKPEPLPGKPYARLSGAAQTRQEQPDERPEALSEEQSTAGLRGAQEAAREHATRQHAETEHAVAEAKRKAGLEPEREHMAHVRERFAAEQERLIRKANPRIRKNSTRWQDEAFKDEHIRPAWAAAHDSVAQQLEAAHAALAPHERGVLAGRRLAQDAHWHRTAAQQYRGVGLSDEIPDDPDADRALAERLRPHLDAELEARAARASSGASARERAQLHADLAAAGTPQAMVLALAQHIDVADPSPNERNNTAKVERIKRLMRDAAQRAELPRSDSDYAFYAAHALHRHSFGALPGPADLPAFNNDVRETLRYAMGEDRQRSLSSRLAHEHAQRAFEHGVEDVRAGRRSAQPRIAAGPAPIDQSHHYLPGTAPDILERANKRAQQHYAETQQGAHEAMASLPEHMRRLIAAAGTTTYAHGNYASDVTDASRDAGGDYRPHLALGEGEANRVNIYRTSRANARTVAAHEYAHAHDEALGRVRNGAQAIDRFGVLRDALNGHWRSEEPDFRRLYSKYRDDERIPDYMRKNNNEFYAEGLAWHHGHSNYELPKEKLREVAPDIADKFDQIMRESEEAAHGHGQHR